MIATLVKDHGVAKRNFQNATRQNGVEAWLRPVEPRNEDKALVRKDLLPKVINPRHATNVDDLNTALSEWDTNRRQFLLHRPRPARFRS